MNYFRDLLDRLISDDHPDRVSAILALMAGGAICLAFTALVAGSIYLRDGLRYAYLASACLATLTSLALFGKK